MELQWSKHPCTYIKTHIRQVQALEQTQELRLTEEMPDIGKVLCAWGQPVIRSKEWRSDAIVVAGGINASVIYLPENGSGIINMETWIPFQTKWVIPSTSREGTMRVKCNLRELDARVLSARKMMIRANLAVFGEALESTEADIFTPEELPEGIEVLTNLYPALIPKEAGEKSFLFEEDVPVTDSADWISLALEPEITEQNVIGSRAVIRGYGKLHYVYLDEECKVKSGNQQIPFAQFIDLDSDYDKDAIVDIILMTTSLEHEPTEDGIKVQCGVAAQYVVWNRELLEIAEDVYSNTWALSVNRETAVLPMQLDNRKEIVRVTTQSPGGRIVDVVYRPDFPVTYREGDDVNIEIPGNFQILYQDDEGNLQSVIQNAVGTVEYAAAESCQLFPIIHAVEADENSVRINLDLQTRANQELSMISGLTVGDLLPSEQVKPSLILRRMDTDSLWQLAKETGSTMNAIRKANQLTQDPCLGEMLLIPLN